MKLGELRRQNLLLILEHVFDGKPTLLAKRMNKSGAQISQWKSGHRDIHEDSARLIELAANKPVGWMDLPHDSGHEGLVTREPLGALPFYLPKPAPRVALEALCDELARVPEPERRESIGALLKACAVAGGDTSYIEPILSLLRFRASQPNAQSRNTA